MRLDHGSLGMRNLSAQPHILVHDVIDLLYYNTGTIRQQPANCVSVFDLFVGLALKGLIFQLGHKPGKPRKPGKVTKIERGK